VAAAAFGSTTTSERRKAFSATRHLCSNTDCMAANWWSQSAHHIGPRIDMAMTKLNEANRQGPGTAAPYLIGLDGNHACWTVARVTVAQYPRPLWACARSTQSPILARPHAVPVGSCSRACSVCRMAATVTVCTLQAMSGQEPALGTTAHERGTKDTNFLSR
jgi:hypothetical protein